MDREEKLTAFCSSNGCGGRYEMKPKANAPRGAIDCPDCGWALFWMHPEMVGVELGGKRAHRFGRSIYKRDQYEVSES